MKTPRFFLGAIVLFWGYQVQILWVAVCAGAVLESARLLKSRFQFTSSDFNRFVDISTIFLAGSIVVALTIKPETAILMLLKWLPLIFFPIIAAQEFSVNNEIDIQSFFLAARKKMKQGGSDGQKIDVSYIYGLFCLLSAGTANTKGVGFYLFCVLFFAWGLWPVRSRRVSFLLWVVCIAAGVVFGYAGQKTMLWTRMKIHRWVMGYYADYYAANPFKTHTALGEITTLKFSDKIVLRVFPQDYIPGKTYLLHTATYTRFVLSTWFARDTFSAVTPALDSTFWQINPPVENTKIMTVYSRLVKKRAVLSLPQGVTAISQMKTGSCEKNALQSVRIEDGPDLIKSQVSYTGDLSYDSLPNEVDLIVPEKELPGIQKTAEKLMLENKTEQEILSTVKHFFLTQYSYSLALKGKGSYQTPLQNFLFYTKAGHCEFFATATALLLRKAGIPARYATGYIVHEYSRMGSQMVVRKRDAHAWVKVFINGEWINFDTTPPSFLQEDIQKNKASLVGDLFSFVGFKLSQFRYETGPILINRFGLWLILPLGIIVMIRLRTSGKIKRVSISENDRREKIQRTADISFYRIEEALSNAGFPRYPYETYQSWITRIGYQFDEKNLPAQMLVQLQHHNACRFSKYGLSKDGKRKHDAGVKMLLEQLAEKSLAG